MIDSRIIATGWHLCPMESGSKNPGSILGANWPAKCSNDPAVIAAWPEDCNIGVLLGPRSGIIDLEYDSDQGEMLVEDWIETTGVVTPSYRSAKSVHRLFRWEDRFELDGAKFGLYGVEFRFGCDKAQSVIPPSLHESGVRYEWIVPPWECEIATLPELIYKQFLNMKQSSEKQAAKACRVDPRYSEGDSLLTKARNHIEQVESWESILSGDGWKFCRNRGEAQDWWRPGKSKGSISGTVNYGGSKTIRIFTTSVNGLKAESSYDKFAYLCVTRYNDDPVKAAFGLCPEDVLGRKQTPVVDLKPFWLPDEEPESEEFFESMLPDSGLLRDIFEFYRVTSQFPSFTMGMATALSVCQTLFGRRLRSQTDLRTNDYNVVMAPTGAGKEACETTILKLFAATGHDLTHPPDVQSGNGFLSMVAAKPCGIWVCDEFGKTLEAMLDKKANQHLKLIATHLLKIYGKAGTVYGGAAHAAGAKNRIDQPHLCMLGMTTPKVFNSITADEVDDGLFGRLAFFCVQDRPKMVISPTSDPPAVFVDAVKRWIEWEPKNTGNINPDAPRPVTLNMTPETFARWREHSDKIREKMDSEGELRAGVWVRVAARTMKLAMVYRAARHRSDPASTDWAFVKIEPEDIEWSIKVSNFLARTSCNLLLEDVVDTQEAFARKKILAALQNAGEVTQRQLRRQNRKVTSAQFLAAGRSLEQSGLIEISISRPQRGPEKVVYKNRGQVLDGFGNESKMDTTSA
jgi:hypothetical protein